MLPLPCSLNIQNHNWNEVEHHINRTFEDTKTGTHQDDNMNHIETQLSKYNMSTDGVLYNGRFLYDNKLNNQRLRGIEDQVNKAFANYVKAHNGSKSVKSNPDRAIKNLFKEKLLNKKPSKTDLKNDKNNKNKLEVYQKTFVQNIGNSDINNKIINLIKRHKHESYKKARNQFLKAGSLALYLNATTLNSRHKNMIPLHCSTNVDEVVKKIKGELEKPDSIHCHSAVLGYSYTKLDDNFKPTKKSKPSFNFGRSLCFAERVHYSKKRIKVNANNRNGYKYVNQSISQALKKFRMSEGKNQTRIFNQILKSKLHMDLHFKYAQTGQKHNGKSMESERVAQQKKHLEIKRQKEIKQARKIRARKNYRNAINRRRTYERNYKKHKRHLAIINAKASSASAVIKRASEISASFSNSAEATVKSALSTNQEPESPEKPLRLNLPVATPQFLAHREHEEKINHQKLIEKANKNTLANQYKKLVQSEKVEKANEAKIKKQDRQIKLNQIKIEYQRTTLGRLSSKFSAVLGHYKKSFKAIADDTIKSTKEALKQTSFQHKNENRATTSIRNKVINSAVMNLRSKAKAEPATFMGKIKKNWFSARADRKQSQALQSLNNSVAKPIQERHDSWVSLKDSLNLNANNLYQNDYEKLTTMNSEKPPLDSAQFSAEIKSATGLNLVQYSQSASISASASVSKAKPAKESQRASLRSSFDESYSSKSEIVHEKSKSLEAKQKGLAKIKERDNYFQNLAFQHKMETNPKFRAKVNKIRAERNRGPQL